MSEMTLEEAKEFVRWYKSRTLEELSKGDDERLLAALKTIREGKGDE